MFWNIPISTFSAGLVLKSVSLLVPLHISSRKTWSSFYSTLLKWSLSKAFKNISTKGTFGTRTPSYSKESWKVDPTYSVRTITLKLRSFFKCHLANPLTLSEVSQYWQMSRQAKLSKVSSSASFLSSFKANWV